MKKTSRLNRLLAACLMAGALLLNSGCWLVVIGAAAGAGVAGTAYVNGELDTSLGNNFENVVAATNKAIEQLQFTKPEEQKDAMTDTLTTHNAKDDRVRIVVTKVNDTNTKLTIRIGTFGDEAASRTILDKIKANL